MVPVRNICEIFGDKVLQGRRFGIGSFCIYGIYVTYGHIYK